MNSDWSVAMDGYKLFRMERRGRRGGGAALYVRKRIECEEMSLENSHNYVESLWARISKETRLNPVVGI